MQATIPRYGPPYWSGMPSGWPSPAAMSAPYSPGGASTASDTGSMTLTNSAPGRMREAPDARHVLEQAEDRGLGRDDARDRPVGIGEQPLERLEVRRARAGPPATSGTSSTTRPAPSA